MGVKFDVSSARSGGSGDQPIPGSLEEMEQKFKAMTVNKSFFNRTFV